MTDEQKNLTIGQVIEAKKEMEESIKNAIEKFVNTTGCNAIDVCGHADYDLTNCYERELNIRVQSNYLNLV